MSRRRRLLSGGGIGSLLSGDNIQLWLDASDTSTITQSEGSVSQWNDKSGNGNNVIQATGANQPTTGTNTLNGKNALSFNGTAAYMQNAGLQNIISRLNAFTIAIVFKMDVDDASRLNLIGSSLSSGDRTAIARNTGNGLVSATFNGSAYTLKAAAFTNTADANLVIMTNSSANAINQYINGTESTLTSGAPATGATNIFRLGTRSDLANFWDGLIAEVLIFNKAITANERAVMNAYLSNKWGI